ncbi:MAG TPA: hypothetical protein VJ793_00390 [Anaerolineae bacterium]|nr:hypothetical protein [Anaerolineae bacterium]
MENEEREPVEEFSREELDRAFSEAIMAAEHLHRSLASATENAGYARQILVTSHPRYVMLYEKAKDDPSFYPIVASGLNFIKSITGELNQLSGLVNDVQVYLEPVAFSTGSFGGSVDAAFALSRIHDEPAFEPIPAPLPRKSREEYSSRLKALDPSLSLSYDQVWQTYYGTSADRYRASLFMMRQVFDHFFSCLAPDDLVRQSEFWKRKQGEKPDQIYRSERIRYAAHTHVKRPGQTNILAASARQISDLYEAANEAHKRGTLDEANANKALLTMNSILKDWIDALP